MSDSATYKKKKAFFNNLITLYGRNVTVEVLQDETVDIHKVHLSKSNQQDGSIKKIIALANKRAIEIVYHEKNALSRISKNAKQDQGVAIDIVSKSYQDAHSIATLPHYRLIALDGIQNPQNLGMIIRSCAAGYVDGIILPKKSSAKLSPLVMKASAGTLFKLPIYFCNTLEEVLKKLDDTKIYTLSSHADDSLYDLIPHDKEIFVLGNESEGVSDKVQTLCKNTLKIPMQRGVESLNVAITASLIAFHPYR